MALSAAETALLARLKAGLAGAAKRIQDLVTNPPADDAEFNTALGEVATGLEALAGAITTP